MSVLKFRDPTTNEWKEIIAIQGPQGQEGPQGIPGETGPQGEKGDKGEPGNDYVLTNDDKATIAQMAIELMPVAEEGTY